MVVVIVKQIGKCKFSVDSAQSLLNILKAIIYKKWQIKWIGLIYEQKVIIVGFNIYLRLKQRSLEVARLKCKNMR